MDLTVWLHRTFLDGSGQRRRGLTAQEKLQGFVVVTQQALAFQRLGLSALAFRPECIDSIYDVVSMPGAWCLAA